MSDNPVRSQTPLEAAGRDVEDSSALGDAIQWASERMPEAEWRALNGELDNPTLASAAAQRLVVEHDQHKHLEKYPDAEEFASGNEMLRSMAEAERVHGDGNAMKDGRFRARYLRTPSAVRREASR
jgi:hypothetical protein